MSEEPQSQLLLYQTSDGATGLEVRLESETVWLSQNQMAELFQTSIPNVSMHIRNVFAERELNAGSVIKEFLTTASDGKNYRTKFYNLDVIISVGYRVKSHCSTQFLGSRVTPRSWRACAKGGSSAFRFKSCLR